MDENDPKNYSKREIDHWFRDLFSRLDKQDTVLVAIKEQTTRTNGRVNKLEWWRGAFIWALGAMWTLLLIVIPLLYKAFYKDLYYKIKTAVVEAVDNKISEANYEK